MLTDEKEEHSKFPVSGKGYTWKVNKPKKSQHAGSVASSENKVESAGVSEEDWVDAKIRSRTCGKEHQRHHSTELKTVNIQKSPLDKQFFMRKIQLSKRMN